MRTEISKVSQPAHRALAGAGITCLEDLTKLTEKELGKLHGMGPNAMGKLKEAMKASGLEFAP